MSCDRLEALEVILADLEDRIAALEARRPAKPRAVRERIVAPEAPLLPSTNGEWGPMVEEMAAWGSAYPGLDVAGSLEEIRAWLVSNPTRRKTPSGMGRFVNGWLKREQDRL